MHFAWKNSRRYFKLRTKLLIYLIQSYWGNHFFNQMNYKNVDSFQSNKVKDKW